MIKLIVNCGPCEEFIGKCLESVLRQTVRTWEAYVTVDPCGDDTFAKVIGFSSDPLVRRLVRQEIAAEKIA